MKARVITSRASRHPARSLVSLAAVVVLIGGIAQEAPPVSAAVFGPGTCNHPAQPAWFHPQVLAAIRISADIPASWATSPYIARIVCRQGTGFNPGFTATGGGQQWHGMFAMTVEEMQTIFGPWMTGNRYAYRLSATCFVRGWVACPHTAGNAATIQQLIAGLRWIWLNYGSPVQAWRFIQSTGRFNSYPMGATDDPPARTPFALCPVASPVNYRDDFGEFRNVGGYHPHWGNDVIAPTGRPIRAPFDGLAVAHSDNWFAGNWVTVIGPKGYVRNGHMSRFGNLGFVKAGTVIGYVGSTGDALSPHDHFEWHPWVLPTPLYRAPTGFRRIMDGVDPYPFLNTVCR